MIFSLLAGLGATFLVCGGAVVILTVFGKWKVYQKAGKEGWEALIPFYTDWVLVEISGLKQWFFYCVIAGTIASALVPGLTGIAGIVALAARFFCNYNLALKFKKDPIGYGIGLTVLPFVFYPILGFRADSVFTNAKVSAYGPISEEAAEGAKNSNKNTNSTASSNNVDVHFCKNCGAPVGNEKFCTKCGTQIH